MNRLQILLANPHTTWAAVAYVLAKMGSELGAVWLPAHASQFKATADIVEAAAVAWGLLSAGDASQGMAASQANSTAIQAVHDVAVQSTPETKAAAAEAVAKLPTPK